MEANSSDFFEKNELQKINDESMTKIVGGVNNNIDSTTLIAYGFAPICIRKIKLDSEGNVKRNKSIDLT